MPKQLNEGKNSLSNKWFWGNWISTYNRLKLNANFTPYIKSNSKWIKDLLFYSYNSKMLRRNHRSQSSWSWIKPCFLRYDSKSNERENRDKRDITKTENFCALIGTIKKVKHHHLKVKQPNKGLISRIYKEPLQLKDKDQKVTKGLDRQSSKEDIQSVSTWKDA